MTIKTHGRMVTDNTVGIPQLAVTDGSPGQAIVTDGQGTMTFATVGAGGAVGSSTFVEDIFTGDGTTATFTLSTGAPYEESILTFIDGVAQPTSAFTLPSTTSITFSPAPSNGAAIRVCHLGIASSVADNSITGAKLSMGGDVAGDILYYNGTDYQKLGIGTAGQLLATNSAANAPEWTTGWNYDISFIAGYSFATVAQAVVVQTYDEMVMARTGIFEGEVGYIDTVCTGSALICDVLKNGTSIYSTKPQFAVSTNAMTAGVLSTTAFASGDRITFKVTQIGSTDAGEGVRFMLKCKA